MARQAAGRSQSGAAEAPAPNPVPYPAHVVPPVQLGGGQVPAPFWASAAKSVRQPVVGGSEQTPSVLWKCVGCQPWPADARIYMCAWVRPKLGPLDGLSITYYGGGHHMVVSLVRLVIRHSVAVRVLQRVVSVTGPQAPYAPGGSVVDECRLRVCVWSERRKTSRAQPGGCGRAWCLATRRCRLLGC